MNKSKELQRLIDNPSEFIALISEKIGRDYDGPVGLRGMYADESLGDLSNSKVWDDGNITDIDIDGTCAIKIAGSWGYDPEYLILENIKRYAKQCFIYGDGKIGLVIGNDCLAGEDFGELIIDNAKCVYIFGD